MQTDADIVVGGDVVLTMCFKSNVKTFFSMEEKMSDAYLLKVTTLCGESDLNSA